MLISATAILGSMVLIWGNASFSVEQQKIGDYYEKNSNLLKESFMIADVWLSKTPPNYVNVTLRNNADIAIDIKEMKIIGLKDDGSTFGSPVTVSAPFTGSPANSDGVIASKQTLRIDVSYTWNDANIKTLDISITTERGSVERILWKIS